MSTGIHHSDSLMWPSHFSTASRERTQSSDGGVIVEETSREIILIMCFGNWRLQLERKWYCLPRLGSSQQASVNTDLSKGKQIGV